MPLGSKSKEQAKKNQQRLLGDLSAFLGNVEALRPTVSDKAAFEKLVAAVQQATEKNEDVAQFTARLEGAGSAVLSLAKTLSLVI